MEEEKILIFEIVIYMPLQINLDQNVHEQVQVAEEKIMVHYFMVVIEVEVELDY